MSISQIRGEVVSQLATIITDTAVQIISEGTTHKPAPTETFVRVKVLPAEGTLMSIGIGYRQMQSGLVQIDVIGPRINGIAAVETIADSIVQQFNRDPNPLTSGRFVVYSVWAEQINEEATRFTLPVLLRWEFTSDIA